MDKLSASDINKVKDVLTGFIKEAASCEDNEQLHKMAVSYFGNEFKGEKLPLVKQACAAFNSNKAMYKLSSADPSSDFAIIDGNRVFAELTKGSYNHIIEKAAGGSLAVVFGKVEQPLQKAASAMCEKPVAVEKPAEESTMSKLELHNYINDVTKDRERLIAKMAARKDICKFEALDLSYDFCRRLNSMTKEARANFFNTLLSVYPVDGKELVEAFNNYNPLNKVASFSNCKGSKTFPTGDIYTKAKDCMVANYAAKQADRMFKEACAETLESYKRLPGIYVMYKHAAGIASSVGKAALAHPIIAELAEGNTLKTSDVYNDVMSRKLINELRELETKNVLVDMYSEPFIASYPADEIEEATVKALQQLPPAQRKHPRKHISLLKTWVADILGRGGNISAADADKILSTQTAFSRYNPTNLSDLTQELI